MSNTNPIAKQNVLPDHPELKDLLDLFKKDILLNLNCHHIGTIESFNSSSQTVSATINYKKTFFNLNENAGTYTPVLMDYPVLMDCPAIVLGGGGSALTFPIQKGDECLVLFNDRNLDNWLQSGAGSAPANSRLHSFADGIVIVGLRSASNQLANYDTSRAVLRNQSVALGVNTSKVLITNDYPMNSTTLNSILQSLITAITAASYGGNHLDSAAPFIAVATQLGSLLE